MKSVLIERRVDGDDNGMIEARTDKEGTRCAGARDVFTFQRGK
jgi:hypothetical protein